MSGGKKRNKRINEKRNKRRKQKGTLEWVDLEPNSTELVDFGDGVKLPMYEVVRELTVESLDKGVEDEVTRIELMMRVSEGLMKQPSTSAISDFIHAYKMKAKCKEEIEEIEELGENSQRYAKLELYEILKLGFEGIEKIRFHHSVGDELCMSYEEYKKLSRPEIDTLIEKTYIS